MNSEHAKEILDKANVKIQSDRIDILSVTATNADGSILLDGIITFYDYAEANPKFFGDSQKWRAENVRAFVSVLGGEEDMHRANTIEGALLKAIVEEGNS